MRDRNQGELPDLQNEELGEESESEEGQGIRQFDAGEEPAGEEPVLKLIEQNEEKE